MPRKWFKYIFISVFILLPVGYFVNVTKYQDFYWGCLLTILGGLLAFTDKYKKNETKKNLTAAGFFSIILIGSFQTCNSGIKNYNAKVLSDTNANRKERINQMMTDSLLKLNSKLQELASAQIQLQHEVLNQTTGGPSLPLLKLFLSEKKYDKNAKYFHHYYAISVHLYNNGNYPLTDLQIIIHDNNSIWMKIDSSNYLSYDRNVYYFPDKTPNSNSHYFDIIRLDSKSEYPIYYTAWSPNITVTSLNQTIPVNDLTINVISRNLNLWYEIFFEEEHNKIKIKQINLFKNHTPLKKYSPFFETSYKSSLFAPDSEVIYKKHPKTIINFKDTMPANP